MSQDSCAILPEEEEEFLALWIWYQTHWVEFIEQVLQVNLEPGQKELVELVQNNERTEATCCHGAGKALALDTPLPTPTGWTTMGEVKVGDTLYDERGKECGVSYVAPIEMRECYEITFSDGTKVITSAEHDWNVISSAARQAITKEFGKVYDWRDYWKQTRKLTTKYLAKQVEQGGTLNYRIPCSNPLEIQEKELLVDPYILGFWLGDGTSASGDVAIGWEDKDDCIKVLESHGATLKVMPSTLDVKGTARHSILGLMPALRKIGVLGDKHIPEQYLRASYEQRLDLLKGIMDTDGCATGNSSSVVFGFVNETLAKQTCELVRTLGFKITTCKAHANGVYRGKTKTGEPLRRIWESTFSPDISVFNLPRKTLKWQSSFKKTSYATARSICAIEMIPTVPTRCISVDSPSHLFLCTESFIPTHNTFTSACIGLTVMSLWPFATFVSTAPTFRQIEKLLWAEIGRRYHSSLLPDLGFPPPNATNWKIAPGWFGTGESSDSAEKLEGFHSPTAIFYLVDEAKAVPDAIFQSLEGGMNSPFTRQLRITTPGPSRGEAWKCSRGSTKGSWKHLKISAWDVPRLRRWAQERKEEWGEDSPIYKMRVLGEYVDGFQNELFSEATIAKMASNYADGGVVRQGIKVISADIATKNDRTVFTYRTGNYIDSQEKVDGLLLPEIADLLFKRAIHFKADYVVVDALNLGIGVHDALVIKGLGDKVIPFITQAKAEEDIYFNRKAELAFKVKKGILDGAIGGVVCDELKADLLGYDYEIQGRAQTEVFRLYDPDESPDFGDSLFMAFATDFNVVACVSRPPEQQDDGKKDTSNQPGAERKILAEELAHGRIPEKIQQKYGGNVTPFRRGRRFRQ